MSYQLTRLTEEEAKTISHWRYDPPYDFYNLPDNQVEIAVENYLLPEYAYHSIHDEQGELIGFCTFGEDARVSGGDYDPDALDIGLGIRPDLTGKGLGAGVLAEILVYAHTRYTVTAFRATIAAFNQRSQRLFLRAGFQETDHFQSPWGMEFLILVRSEAIQA